MALVTVRHQTVYRYSEPVEPAEHRMMFRPRESHDLRLLSSVLEIHPRPAKLRWIHDIFDNSVAIATFNTFTPELSFRSEVTLEHLETDLPEYSIEDYAKTWPFTYSDDDLPSLLPALAHRSPCDEAARWAQQFRTTSTLNLLRDISNGIRNQCIYMRRREKGVQTPDETLFHRSGSCRDFAVLMMEAVRSLGLAARFVSGYIVTQAGSTHAWMQVYLPGSGWIDFDPTNSIVGNRNLIRVAVAWSPDQVLPLWGTYYGPSSSFLGMEVSVAVNKATP